MWADCFSWGQQLGEGFCPFTDFPAGASPDSGVLVKAMESSLCWLRNHGEIHSDPAPLRRKKKEANFCRGRAQGKGSGEMPLQLLEGNSPSPYTFL